MKQSVSVVLPNFNHGHWLPQALNALVSQAVPPAEIIVINDGSTDDSDSVIESFARRYSSIRPIRHDVNRGTAAAVEAGIAAATGRFLLFAAADDFVLPGLIGRAERALNENPRAAFYCAEVAILDKEENIIGFRPFTAPRGRSGFVSPDEARRELARSDNWCVGPSVVFRREALASIGYFDRTLGSLCDGLATRLLALRDGFYFDAEVLATWRVYPESASASSALSQKENRRQREVGRRYIAQHFPADVATTYAHLFDRRLRFNMARLGIVWSKGGIDADGIADAIDGNALDRAILRLCARSPIATSASLAWMTLRMRPYGPTALLRTGWRALTVHPARRRMLRRLTRSDQACART